MLFGILILAALMSYIIPAGKYERILLDSRETVVAGSYKIIESTPLSLMDLFMCLPLGFKSAVDIIFIVLASGIMFGFLEYSKSFENAIGVMVHRFGKAKKYLLVVVMTFVFGALGVFVGYENNIAMIPIAALLSLAIGGDLILAAGISVGAVTIGFGLSPFNPYTIGTGQKLAELPLFSGAVLRSVLCLFSLSVLAWYNVRYFKTAQVDPSKSLGIDLDTSGLSLSKPLDSYVISNRNKLVLLAFMSALGVILYGVFVHKWFINQISAIFCMLAVVIGLINRNSGQQFGSIILKSVSVVAPGAFMVGFATSIKVALETGQINDTIAESMALSLSHLPLYLAGAGMAMAQTLMNFLIPSGSGQALATLPVMIPAGEVIGLTRQTIVLAYQVGDGISNLINPALGGLIAMLSMSRVPFDRWLKFIFPVFSIIYIISLIFVMFSVMIQYGPF